MRLGLLPIVIAASIVPGTAWGQASLRVQPLSVDVTSPSQASAITLQNSGANEISLQIRLFEWSQADGKDKLMPTGEVVASPPATRIPAGQSYTIRVARTAGTVAEGEKSYRLWIDELPLATPARASGGEVDVRLRYDLPVFFHAPDVRAQLSWRVYRADGALVVEAANSGTRRARVEGLKIETAQGPISLGEGLNGYVLAGSTRNWTVPAGTAIPAAGARATIVAGISGSDVRQSVKIAEK